MNFVLVPPHGDDRPQPPDGGGGARCSALRRRGTRRGAGAGDCGAPAPARPPSRRTSEAISSARALGCTGRPETLFTPSTKAEAGEHGENIDSDAACRLVGAGIARRVRDASLALYRFAAEHARAHGITIADKIFEFAVDGDGDLILIDEVLIPASSRFWTAGEYAPGMRP